MPLWVPRASPTDPDFSGTFAPATALYLPGVSGNYASTPDAASLDITGDIDIRAEVALDSWVPADFTSLLLKGTTYGLVVAPDGTLRMFVNAELRPSTVATGFVAGSSHWVRVTRTAPSGGVIFYTSTDGVTWTPLGAPVTSTAGNLAVNTTEVRVGTRVEDIQHLAGKVHRAQLYDGIDGTLVADYRADAPMGPRYRDSTGKVWTINGTAWTWVVA